MTSMSVRAGGVEDGANDVGLLLDTVDQVVAPDPPDVEVGLAGREDPADATDRDGGADVPLGVEDEDPGGADDDVVDAGPPAGDASVGQGQRGAARGDRGDGVRDDPVAVDIAEVLLERGRGVEEPGQRSPRATVVVLVRPELARVSPLVPVLGRCARLRKEGGAGSSGMGGAEGGL